MKHCEKHKYCTNSACLGVINFHAMLYEFIVITKGCTTILNLKQNKTYL